MVARDSNKWQDSRYLKVDPTGLPDDRQGVRIKRRIKEGPMVLTGETLSW